MPHFQFQTLYVTMQNSKYFFTPLGLSLSNSHANLSEFMHSLSVCIYLLTFHILMTM
jgi:hypothetical protein